MSLLRAFKITTFCLTISSFLNSHLSAQVGSPEFVKVNPAGTYLFVDSTCFGDQAATPTTVTLSNLGATPGMFLRLTRVGAFQAGEGFNDDQTTLGAVFRGPAGFIPPGPNGQNIALNSLPTACNNLPTDIPEDFNAESQITVEVPVGATELLFTGNDSFWSDNTDPNNDYGVSIEVLSLGLITIQQTGQFCDNRSVNDVNFGIGKRITVTADLTPDGDLTDVSGDGPPDGFADSDDISPPSVVRAAQDGVNRRLNYFPLPNSPNHFARSIRFDCDNPGVPDLRDAWNLSITNDTDDCVSGACTLEDGTPISSPITPSVTGVPHLPFVESFTFQVTGDPKTPIFNWTVPSGSSHDQVTIWIQDLEEFIGQGGVGGGGAARVIRSRRLADNATSFQVPLGWLEEDHLYSVSIQLDKRRGPQPEPFGRLESRSRAFFSFKTVTLPTGGAPVYLPSVNPDGVAAGQPVYEFSISNVSSTQTTFIDPPVAIGYDYRIGVGDPNFASVLLPPVGDNFFDVYLWSGSDFVFYATVRSGDEYPFPAGGVDRFRVLGVEPGLDPNNPTAFVTGLKFTSDGQFTGTMTPIIISDVTTAEVKPGGDGPNCINPKSKGNVSFAILGGSVDVMTVDLTSLEIDDDTNTVTAGVEPVKSSIKDINGDGINDLILHFKTQDLSAADLLSDGRTLYLTGQLSDGTLLVGFDVVYLSDGPTCN